ncbi:MAG: SDR family NAD(P)-dependent oxidoreductase [Alphaproteobacteria bacterium]
MTDISLSDKVVIITGGGRGLGRAMTLSLAAAGAKVVAAMHIADDLEPLEADARALAGDGAVHAVLADIRHPDDCADLVRTAITRFGRLDVLVNNAGVGMLLFSENYTSEPTKFWQAAVDPVRTVIETNLFAPFLMAREAMPHMLEQGWGRIINVTTSIHTMQRRGYFPYGATKAGFEAATRIWSEDAEGTGVTINILIPGGATDTNILPGRLGDKSRSGADGKLLEPEVMAAPIRWLASPASDGITGMRFIGDKWDPSLDADEAAKAAMAPAGFDPRAA